MGRKRKKLPDKVARLVYNEEILSREHDELVKLLSRMDVTTCILRNLTRVNIVISYRSPDGLYMVRKDGQSLIVGGRSVWHLCRSSRRLVPTCDEIRRLGNEHTIRLSNTGFDIHIDVLEPEKPLYASGQLPCGYLDIYFSLRVEPRIPTDIPRAMDASMYRDIAVRIGNTILDTDVVKGFIEVKTRIHSVGSVLRELKFYRDILRKMYDSEVVAMLAVPRISNSDREILTRQGIVVITSDLINRCVNI